MAVPSQNFRRMTSDVSQPIALRIPISLFSSALNPDALIPVLDDDGRVLTQSLAIIEYLDETRPEPPLLPRDALERAYVRAFALGIACEIHPLNNLRVLGYLRDTLGVSDAQRNAWYRHWTETGLATVEAMLASSPHTGVCCHGDTPTLADICLVPQIANAQRVQARLDHVPTVMRIHRHCLTLEAFAQSVPALQPDAE